MKEEVKPVCTVKITFNILGQEVNEATARAIYRSLKEHFEPNRSDFPDLGQGRPFSPFNPLLPIGSPYYPRATLATNGAPDLESASPRVLSLVKAQQYEAEVKEGVYLDAIRHAMGQQIDTMEKHMQSELHDEIFKGS